MQRKKERRRSGEILTERTREYEAQGNKQSTHDKTECVSARVESIPCFFSVCALVVSREVATGRKQEKKKRLVTRGSVQFAIEPKHAQQCHPCPPTKTISEQHLWHTLGETERDWSARRNSFAVGCRGSVE